MARELPISLRAKRQQVTAAQRRGSSPSVKSGYISRERIGATIVQAQRLAASQQSALNDVISKISSLTNLNQINAVLNAAPSIISAQVAAIRKNITDQQTQTISQLKTLLASKYKIEESYSSRRKKYSDDKTSSRYIRYKAKEEELEEEISAIEKVLREMNAGNLYDYDSVVSYVNDVGSYERQKTTYSLEKKKAQSAVEAEALKETLANIKQAGYTPVYNASTGALLGYQTGKDTGYAEYRFDSSGNSYLLKSSRFKPVYSGGKLTGYEDIVAGMSIGVTAFDKYIENINKAAQQAEVSYKLFQNELSNLKLPSGYKWEIDNSGNIVSIDDINRGVNIDIADLPSVTNAWMLNPKLVKIYGIDYKTYFKELAAKGKASGKVSVPSLKWYEKFWPESVVEYTYKKRYNFYKDLGGTLSYENFVKEQWKAVNKDFQNTTEGKKIVKALSKSLDDQIQNPENYGTTARISALLSVGSGVGLPSAGLILFGSSYYTTLGIAKDVSRSQLPKDFKATAKLVAKNFGLGAVQGLLYGLAFKGSSTILNKLGRPLLNVTFGKVAGKAISAATKKLIQRGLSILGVNYVSRLAGRTAYSIKNIAVGDVEAGVSELSKEAGILVGFALPGIIVKAVKSASNKDIAKIKINKKTGKVKMTANQRKAVEAEVTRLQNLRKGQLNAAYLKAKNAQVNSKIRGKVVTIGRAKKLSPSTINQVYAKSKNLGISKTQLLEGSYYKQTIRVKSSVGRTEALLKYYNQLLSGRLTGGIKAPSQYYTFERYGISVVRTNSKGVSEGIAIEFNLNGNKASNFGFKYGVGVGKTSLVSVYTKARSVKGQGIRVRLQDVYVSQNKFQSSTKVGNDFVKTLNKLETKKVLLNGKRLSKREIILLKNALKTQAKVAGDKNLESTLIKLFKNNKITGTSGYTNTVRLTRIKNGISIRLGKTSVKGIKVSPKGQFIEFGVSKFKIPSIKKVSVKAIPKKIKIKAPSTKVIKLTKVKAKPITSTSKIVTTKTITKIQTKKLEQSIRAIQTITKPITRARIAKRVIPVSTMKVLSRQIGILLPLVSSKNRQALRNIQSNINLSINALLKIQQSKQINTTLLNQVKVVQSKSILALKTITTPKPVTPITPTIPKTPTKKRTTTKKPVITAKVLTTSKAKRKAMAKGDLGYISGLKSTSTRRVTKTLVSVPITKERAFDILAYSMIRQNKRAGLVKKSQKETPRSIINRSYKSVPKGYFKRVRSRFLVRRLKTKDEIYEVIQKVSVPKPKSIPKKAPTKKKVTRNKKVVKRSKKTSKKKQIKKKVAKTSPKSKRGSKKKR